uniref:Uncharacterized protein n=1 Tax=Ciona savignyi TaxID=51511 RepID=H2YDJ4_CIOSA
EEEKAERDRNKMLDDLYHEGMSKINSSSGKSAVLQGYQKLQEAAKLGHADSDVEIGFALLTGQYLPLNVAGAAEIFQKQADKGNPKAQAGLGFLYGSGLGVVSSQSKALVYLTFSALGGDTMGRMMSGYRYWAGVGVTKNCETALTYYKKVAEEVASKVSVAGGPMVSRIRLLDEEENPAASSGRVDDDLIQYYQFLADKGDAPAQVTLGQLYYQGGRGFEQNPRKAYEYFLKAAEANNANGQAYLGKMFAEGADTIKQNNQTALKYYKMAADQGNPIGQAGMGLMYMYGKGLAAADYDKALMYFKMSADQGWPEGQLHLGNMYFNGHGVKRDFSRSIQLFNLAAQNGHLLALYNLGRMHSTGVGAVRSCRTAVELYKNVCERGRWAGYFDSAYSLYKSGRVNSALSIYMLLAELGYEVAQSNVAHILDQGSSTLVLNETYARALLHWDRAASQGYSIARIKLGDYYYYGRGTEVDYEVAAGHYKIASADKNAQATFNLGYMHERGLGLKKDIHLAKRHYDQAATNSPDAAVPVTLALIKVGFLYAVEFLQNHVSGVRCLFQWVSEDNLTRYLPRLSDDWDVYAILILALVLAFVLAFRRHHR